MVDEKEYKAPMDIFYIHSLDDQVKMEVKGDGTLEIIDQDGMVILPFH